MNGKLIWGLSLFGLGMAFASVYFISSKVEPFCWLAIFIATAWQIAKHAKKKFFLHGFLVGVLNCIWVTAARVYLLTPYLAHHAKEAAQYDKLNREIALTPTMAILVMSPIIGIVSSVVLGAFSAMAGGLYQDR